MRADLVEVEPRLEVEIVGAGAVLEVEIDEAGRVRILRRGLAQEHRRLDRQRRRADAAGGRQEGDDLAAVVGQARGRLQGPDAGLEHVLRLDRLAQEIRNPDLEQPAHERVVEGIGDDDHRGAAESAHGDALEGDQALAAARIDVDDDDRGGVDLGALRRLLDALRHDRHRGCMDAAGGARDGVEEARIRPDEQDRRRLRGGVVHLVVLRAKTLYVLVRGGRGARHRHRDRHDRRRCPAAARRTRRLVAVDRVDDAPAADLDLGPG